ncbi:uncharacterized protein LOC120327759 isoform X1 [Styela clava]
MAYGGQPPPQYTASPASYPSNGASATFTPSFSNDASWNSQPVHSVELAISCRGLIDADVFSKSDPMVVMYIQGLGTKEWREYGRTETIQNTLNPDFVTKFVIDYFFEERQALRFDVFDIDSKSAKLTKHDFLGQVFCTLGEIVGSPGSKFQAPLKIESRTKGKIIVTAEELDSSKDVAFMEWNGKKLDKKDLFGKSDPFMVFCRCNEDNSFTVCHKTEVIKNTLNPTWKRMQVPVRTLCNGDLERTIKIEIYDWDRDGGHDLIGIFTTSLSRLMRGPCIENTYECINPKKKKKKKSYKHSGLVNLLSFRIEKQPTFLEYIRSGTELSFVVAIDFTASNGNPMNPNSLHYINPYQPNQYAFAIQAVGEIIQDYDTDKLFPAYGFGARLPPHGQVSHEFAILFFNDEDYLPPEKYKWNAAVRWVGYGNRRLSLLPTLMNTIKFDFLPKTFIATNIRNEPLVESSSECTKLLMDSMFMDKPERNLKTFIAVLYSESRVAVYDCANDIWDEIQNVPKGSTSTICSFNDKLCLLVDEKLYYLNKNQEWISMRSRDDKLGTNVRVAASDDSIYIRDRDYISEYDASTDSWNRFSLQNYLPDQVIVTSSFDGCLYLFNDGHVNVLDKGKLKLTNHIPRLSNFSMSSAVRCDEIIYCISSIFGVKSLDLKTQRFQDVCSGKAIPIPKTPDPRAKRSSLVKFMPPPERSKIEIEQWAFIVDGKLVVADDKNDISVYVDLCKQWLKVTSIPLYAGKMDKKSTILSVCSFIKCS